MLNTSPYRRGDDKNIEENRNRKGMKFLRCLPTLSYILLNIIADHFLTFFHSLTLYIDFSFQ